MSESLSGGFGRTPLPPTDPSQRVERLEREDARREQESSEERRRRAQRAMLNRIGEDSVKISDEARQAYEAANQPPPAPPENEMQTDADA